LLPEQTGRAFETRTMLVTMTVKVLRVELPRTTYEQIVARAGGASIGGVVTDALRACLPALISMAESPLAKGSQAQIQMPAGLDAGLAGLRRKAESTPPPIRFTQVVQLAIPTPLWLEIERERSRLGMSTDDVILWAWRHPPR
jgi:hypothetical protein